MIKRILRVSGKYKGRIYGAMALSFVKGMFMKMPSPMPRRAGWKNRKAICGPSPQPKSSQNRADGLRNIANLTWKALRGCNFPAGTSRKICSILRAAA